jgi:hypothetical protein
MTPSSMLRASLAALAVLALTAGGAGAASGSFTIGTAAGTVVTDSSGNKICRLVHAPTTPSGSSSREGSN